MTATSRHCDWCAKEIWPANSARPESGNHLCIECANAKQRLDAKVERERYEHSLVGRIDQGLSRLEAWMENCSFPCLLALGLVGLGFSARAGVDAIHATHVRYTVRIAGDSPNLDMTFRSLVEAEGEAHRLIGNPETEQERGQAVLIIDQDGRLVDEVTR